MDNNRIQSPYKPVKTKRTRSIARSINGGFASKLFFVLLAVNIIIVMPKLITMLEGNMVITEAQLIELVEPYYGLYIFEGVIWLITLLFGAGGIRKKLRPLDEMAQVTQLVSGFDEAKFQELESAIDSINPAHEDNRLRTGDVELAGLEQAVNKLIERMRDSYRQQARFVSDASHELRTPIAVIQGYANMLDRWGKEDEKVLTESIDAIKAESDRMKRLVEQLLFLARGDSGRIPMKLESLNLSDLMREVYDESTMIDGEHLYELRTDECVVAYGDADMLKQLVRILVENATKYTPLGETIILKAQYKNGVPALTVQDFGVGMAQEDIPHVFERFFRADQSRTRGSGGTGLGLAIAKWIADKHGGWFEITSREELGTRISVYLEAGRLSTEGV